MGKVRTKVIEEALEPEKAKKIEETEKPAAPAAVKEKTGKVKPPKLRSKRYKQLSSLIDKSKNYTAQEAIGIIKKTANNKFDASIEAHINLGLQLDKPEHQIRTLATLPHQVGKKLKLVVFTGKNTSEIKKLGAEVGTETTLKQIESGKIDFDKVISDPSWMPKLAKVAKVLGPKGLMPNPKSGTVSDDPVKTVKEFSGGRTEIRTEKFPIIHIQIGKASFSEKQLLDNFNAATSAINEAKPEGLKKELVKSIYLSSTMGPSIKVNPALDTKEEAKS
jgi:large subunit ribosomal protein L1